MVSKTIAFSLVSATAHTYPTKRIFHPVSPHILPPLWPPFCQFSPHFTQFHPIFHYFHHVSPHLTKFHPISPIFTSYTPICRNGDMGWIGRNGVKGLNWVKGVILGERGEWGEMFWKGWMGWKMRFVGYKSNCHWLKNFKTIAEIMMMYDALVMSSFWTRGYRI